MDLHQLQKKVDQLVSAYEALKKESQQLQSEKESWKAERVELIAQNELAREKVKAILTRLKAMESEE